MLGRCLGYGGAMFRACVGFLLGHVQACPRHVWGHSLDRCWTNVRHVLDKYRTCVGRIIGNVLIMCGKCLGHLLDTCWIWSGHALDMRWTCV